VFCKSSRAGKSIRFRNRHIEVRFLPPQSTSHSTRDSEHLVGENPAFVGLFAHSKRVSSLRKLATLARIC
jgi:hypothetical protein